MRIEFTYTLADIREARVPERFAAQPERYARWWIRNAIVWGFAFAIAGLDVWLARLTPSTASPTAPQFHSYDARIEFAPAVIAALFVFSVYALAIRKSWRALRHRESLSSPDIDRGARRLFALFIGLLAGTMIWLGLFGTWNLTWQLTSVEIVLLTLTPWAGLYVLMQVLGFLQRRALTVGAWRSDAGLQRPKLVTLDDAGFHVHDAQYESRFNWAYFERARETKNLLILIGEGTTQFLIPKRAFADPADLERCRSLIQNVLPKTQFLAKPGGFAVLPKPVLPLPEIATPEEAQDIASIANRTN